MIIRIILSSFVSVAAAGCVTVHGGYKYEYDGRVLRADGRTPVKGASVRAVRGDAPGAPQLEGKLAKSSAKYADKSMKHKTDSAGRYWGVLETVHGWEYKEVMGAHVGPKRAPEPPPLGEVIVYVNEKGGRAAGYRMKVPAEAQAAAQPGVRKVHLPDLLLPEGPTTKSATQPAQ